MDDNGYKYMRQKMDDHEKVDDERHISIQKDLTQLFGVLSRTLELENVVKNMRDNHIAHLQSDMSQLKADVSWLKKFFWVVATSSIASLIGIIFSLIQK